MNYNSVQEIFDAGIANMTILRDNSRQDDGADTITGVDWFTYNGAIASNIYVSGNSWIGFGSSSEHLRVNKRDGALWSLYREEGTLYSYYKFLKIRWRGSSHYSASYPPTNAAYCVEYDVILWDTGDISLHMISIPTSNNTGTYSLVASSTYSYTVSTSSLDVTFSKTDSGFTVSNEIINLELPYDRRYMIRNGSKYYTIANNALSEISVSSLASDVFLNYGIDYVPDISLLNSLSDPELLYWHDSGNDLLQGLVVYGVPSLPQVVSYVSQNVSEKSGIEKVEADASNDVLFLLSFNNGIWKYYDGQNWVASATDSDGMDKKTLNNIPASAWASIFSPTTLTFKCVLPSIDSYTSAVYIKYI